MQLPRAKADVAEKNGAYVVTAELPGVKKEDIHVSIDSAQVTIEAEVKREKETAKDERAAPGSRRGEGPGEVPRTACSTSIQ